MILGGLLHLPAVWNPSLSTLAQFEWPGYLKDVISPFFGGNIL